MQPERLSSLLKFAQLGDGAPSTGSVGPGYLIFKVSAHCSGPRLRSGEANLPLPPPLPPHLLWLTAGKQRKGVKQWEPVNAGQGNF